ncbi:MAG: polysaccharide biosynthesis protein, partial [Erysipelotrichia bacterium]|nr:polysaccharide biosynthesis protein [Erysipelotrichia bacterium]
MSNRKQSVLMGGLISSAGIFISKFLGLLYVVPFNAILQSAANQSYYSQTYNIYSYVLNIATAGLPFAIATLVARYASRNDYRTCLLVKKISFYTMSAFGFICMVIMLLLSGMIAQGISPENSDVNIMRTSIILISFAIFVIPILSSLRGFYQGLKEMEIYSMSQILEQLARIIFLLSVGALIVFVFHQNAVWALYFSILAASISGLLTILYIRWK